MHTENMDLADGSGETIGVFSLVTRATRYKILFCRPRDKKKGELWEREWGRRRRIGENNFLARVNSSLTSPKRFRDLLVLSELMRTLESTFRKVSIKQYPGHKNNMTKGLVDSPQQGLIPAKGISMQQAFLFLSGKRPEAARKVGNGAKTTVSLPRFSSRL